jgi:chromosome segregation ATPase
MIEMIQMLQQQIQTIKEEQLGLTDQNNDLNQKIRNIKREQEFLYKKRQKLTNEVSFLKNKITFFEIQQKIETTSFDDTRPYRLTLLERFSDGGAFEETLGVYDSELEANKALLRHYVSKTKLDFKKNIDDVYSVDIQYVSEKKKEIHEVFRSYHCYNTPCRQIIGYYAETADANKKLEQIRKGSSKPVIYAINTIKIGIDNWDDG